MTLTQSHLNGFDEIHEMISANLQTLTNQLNELLHAYQQLRHENVSLRMELIKLKKTHDLLKGKNQQAIFKIKHVVSQLREEIHERIV